MIRSVVCLPRDREPIVCYLASDEARDVTGQVFGVRGREVFLFSQPRPVATLTSDAGDWTTEGLAKAVNNELRQHFTSLETDLEAFDSEPIV